METFGEQLIVIAIAAAAFAICIGIVAILIKAIEKIFNFSIVEKYMDMINSLKDDE